MTVCPDAVAFDLPQSYEAAYADAERIGDLETAAVVLLRHGGSRIARRRTPEGDRMLSQLRGLGQLFDPMSTLGLRIRAWLAAEEDHMSGNCAAILDVIADATRAGDPVARSVALSLAHQCAVGPDRAALRRSLAAGLIEQSTSAGLRDHLLTGLLWKTVDLFADGDRHAERRLAELTGILAGRDEPAVANAVRAIRVMLSIRAGDFDLAETQAREFLVSGSEPDASTIVELQLGAIRWYQGWLPDEMPDGWDLRLWPWTDTWAAETYLAVELAERRDDAETCAHVYNLLGPYAGRPLIAGPAAVCLGSVEHTLGVAALGIGRLDRAVTHLRTAISENLALQHWPALVLSRFRFAQALERRGYTTDRRLAAGVLATARWEADALGLPHPNYGGEKPDPHTPATCVRTGREWRIRYGRRSVVVRDSVGMAHLAVLLAGPGREIPAVDLVAGVRVLRADGPAPVSDIPTERERARLAVSKAIHRAVRAVTRLDALVGAHLDECVQTGSSCAYLPY